MSTAVKVPFWKRGRLARLDWVTVGLSAIVAAGLVAIVLGFMVGKTTTEAQGFPAEVELVTPKPGDQVERQTQVIADLAPGYQGELFIDGTAVPADQRAFDDAQNMVIFPCLPTDPGCTYGQEGSDDLELPQGRTVRVTVTYWKIADGQGVDDRSFSWSFRTY